MAWRKWFVRGVVFTIAGVCATVAVLYQRWTDPAAVRAIVLAKLRAQFVGAAVTVDAARLRLLGGIVVEEVRLARADDPDKQDFLHIPSAVLQHDKEKMLDGELTLRKVELHRPRLHLVRDKDGRWNMQGITGPFRPDLPLPTFVIHQGTIVFEDKSDGGSGLALELTDLNVVFLNDPLSVVTFEGSARSDLAGLVSVQGAYQRGSGEMQVAIKAVQMPLDAGWANRIVCPTLSDKLQGLHVEGQATVRANLAYSPASQPAFSYDVRLQIDQGKVRHPKLPLPLEALHAVVHCRQGEVRLEKLVARSGPTEIAAHGMGLLPCPDQAFEAHLEIKHLDVNADLFTNMPEKIRKLQPIWQPTGPATLRIACARRAGQWSSLVGGAPSTVTLLPENMKVRFQKFAYPLERVAGSVELNLLDQRTVVDATAYAYDRPIFVKGYWWNDGPEQVDTQWDIVAADLPINDVLIDALPPALQQRARSFHASGKFDVKAHIRRAPAEDHYHHEYHARVHDAVARWDVFPYPVQNVTGFLDIYPNHWEFRDFQGVHPGGGQFTLQGRSQVHGDKLGMVLEISGRNVPVDEDLHQAVSAMPQLGRSWDTLQPRGQLDFAAVIDRRSANPDDVDVRLNLRGPSLQPRFFSFALDEVTGQVHYQRGRVEVTRMQARHGAATLTLEEGTVDLYPGGAYFMDLRDLQARQLNLDADLVRALPRGLQATVAALKVQDPITLRTRLVAAQKAEPGSQPDVVGSPGTELEFAL